MYTDKTKRNATRAWFRTILWQLDGSTYTQQECFEVLACNKKN